MRRTPAFLHRLLNLRLKFRGSTTVPRVVVNTRSPDVRSLGDGCGSFEVSWLRCEDVGFAVFRVVDAFVFSAEVVAPVGVEVAAGGEGTELEDGLGSFQAPSRACYVHSVLYDVAACSFDDSGGDRPALGEGRGVAQVVLLVFQVAGAFVGAGALLRGVAAGGGAAPDPGGGLAGLAVQDLAGLACNPFLSGGLAFVEEGPGGLPEVLKYVDEVDDDRDGDAAARGLGGHGHDLGVVAVHEDGPFPPAARVAAFGLAEGHGDNGGDVAGDRGRQPLALCLRLPRLPLAFWLRGLRLLLSPVLGGRADDVLRRARDGDRVVDAGQLGHPLAAVLFPW